MMSCAHCVMQKAILLDCMENIIFKQSGNEKKTHLDLVLKIRPNECSLELTKEGYSENCSTEAVFKVSKAWFVCPR